MKESSTTGSQPGGEHAVVDLVDRARSRRRPRRPPRGRRRARRGGSRGRGRGRRRAPRARAGRPPRSRRRSAGRRCAPRTRICDRCSEPTMCQTGSSSPARRSACTRAVDGGGRAGRGRRGDRLRQLARRPPPRPRARRRRTSARPRLAGRVAVGRPGEGEHVAAAVVEPLPRALGRGRMVDEVADRALDGLPAQRDEAGAGLGAQAARRRQRLGGEAARRIASAARCAAPSPPVRC